MSKSISAAEEEAMSAALIAQLLQQDEAGEDGYYAEYDNMVHAHASGGRRGRIEAEEGDWSHSGSEGEEDDYMPKKRAKTAQGRAKVAKRPAKGKKVSHKKKLPPSMEPAPVAEPTTEPEIVADASSTATLDIPSEPTKVKEVGKNTLEVTVAEDGMRTGLYSAEEEEKFVEGLFLYGRDWKKIGAFMGTRNRFSVSSHAQKHFIKAYRDGEVLFTKVRESGEGYTLSGAALVPESAASKSYLSGKMIPELSRRANLRPKYDEAIPTADDVDHGLIAQEEEAAAAVAMAVAVAVARKEKAEETKKDEESTHAIPTATEPQSVSTSKEEDKENVLADPTSVPGQEGSTDAKLPPTPSRTRGRGKDGAAKAKTTRRTAEDEVRRAQAMFDGDLHVDPVDGKTDYSRSRPQRSAAARSAPARHIHSVEDPLSMVKCEEYDVAEEGEGGGGTGEVQPFAIRVSPRCLVALDLHAHLRHTEVIGFLGGTWDREGNTLWVKVAYACQSLQVEEGHVSVEMDPESAIQVRGEIARQGLELVGWYHSHPLFAPDPSLVDLENQRNYQRLFREEESKAERFIGVIAGTWDQRLPGSASVHNWFHVPEGRSLPQAPRAKRLRYALAEDDVGLLPGQREHLVRLVEEYGKETDRVAPLERWRGDREETRLDKITRSLGHWAPKVRVVEGEEVTPMIAAATPLPEYVRLIEGVREAFGGWSS